MSAALDLFFVNLPDFVRTTTFRWTSIAFLICILLFSGFVYWEAATYLLQRTDAAIAEESIAIAGNKPDRRLEAIEDRLGEDPRRIKLAGLFGADGHRIAGNLEDLPQGLVTDATVRTAEVVRVDQRGHERMTVRAVARRLPDGNVLVIARHNGELEQLAEVIGRALLVALPMAFGLSLALGAILSIRVQRRVASLQGLVKRIMSGNLSERVPVSGLDHPFDKLAAIANGMLDEIEVLVTDMSQVGNEIAHDLRTPLTRARIALERGRANAATLGELQSVTDRAISALDQSLSVITALLRITEIENNRGRAGFAEVSLADLIREVGDLYDPIAEDKQVSLRVAPGDATTAYCDRDLLFEALANLVDNAVKFTPTGGSIDISLIHGENEHIVRVSDTGPGIQADERDAVMRRFYRSDKSRNMHGAGLGLSLVSAIVKLHGFRFGLNSGAGCVAEIACPVSAN
jgi:signal transduction histidine kinase